MVPDQSTLSPNLNVFHAWSLRVLERTIEPGMSTSSSAQTLPFMLPIYGFRDYLTTWDTSDRPAFLRKCLCFLAFFSHIPLNLINIAILQMMIRMWIFSILWSLLNLFCIGIALWKLDVMRGERLIRPKTYVACFLKASGVFEKEKFETNK